MKLLFSRSFFVAFLIVAGYTGSFAQTTVTLPTIPCSNCNGPGAFSTSAPACTGGVVSPPLTLSWGTATGATSYTVLIATDANLSQNVATITVTGTSYIVKDIALKATQQYYWTVFANNATGSTKATGSVCQFVTDNNWKAVTPTGEFPNGGAGDDLVNKIDSGIFSCQKSDGKCSSGDNILCNSTFKVLAGSNNFTPFWERIEQVGTSPVVRPAVGGVFLDNEGISYSPQGTTTAGKLMNLPQGAFGLYQPIMVRNTSSSNVNYRFTMNTISTKSTTTISVGFLKWGIYKSSSTGWEGYFSADISNPTGVGVNATTNPPLDSKTLTLSTTWGLQTLDFSLPAGTSSAFYIEATNMGGGGTAAGGPSYFTDLRLCINQ